MIRNYIFLFFGILFVGIIHAQPVPGSVIVGANCQYPTSVTFTWPNGGGQAQTRMQITGVSGPQTYDNIGGWASNCPTNDYRTQWFSFYFRTSGFFGINGSGQKYSEPIGNHTGIIARGGQFQQSTPSYSGSYQGIGPIFHVGYGVVGERFAYNIPGNPPAGCQAIATGDSSIYKCPTNGSPSKKLHADFGAGANVQTINPPPLKDGVVYQVNVHADARAMAYWITDTSTNQQYSGWISKIYPLPWKDDESGNFYYPYVGVDSNLRTHGGVGFFVIAGTNMLPYTGNPMLNTSNVQYWGISHGWF